MTPHDYAQRTAPMLLTFANEDVRRTVTTDNVVHISRLPGRAPGPLWRGNCMRDDLENGHISECSLSRD